MGRGNDAGRRVVWRERLEYPKYKHPETSAGPIQQAPWEVALIEGGRFGIDLATEVVFGKFVLHVPADLRSLLPGVWKAAHPDRVRTFRVDEKEQRAQTRRYLRARRRLQQREPREAASRA